MRSSESSGCRNYPGRVVALGALTFGLAVCTVLADNAPTPRLNADRGTAAKAAPAAVSPKAPNVSLMRAPTGDRARALRTKVAAESAKLRARGAVAPPIGLPEGPGPVNDECAGRVGIPCGGSATTDNTLATNNPTDLTSTDATCWIGTGQTNSVWFRFVATGTGAQIDTEASVGTDSSFVVLAVDQAAPCDPLSWAIVGCSEDEGVGFLGNISVSGLTVGNEYVIMLDSWSSAEVGSYTVSVTCGGVCGDGICDAFEDACGCPADCGTPPLDEVGLCADGLDNDCDTLIDCADPDCVAAPNCAPCPLTTCAAAGCDCDVHQMNGFGACDSDGTTPCDVNADTCAADTGVPGDFCQDIQNMVACGVAGAGTTENWFGRCMNAATEGYDDTANISLTSVDWAVLTMDRGTPLDVEVNVWEVPGCPPDFTLATLLSQQIETIPANSANLHLTTVFALPPVIPAGSSFVLEVGTPEDGTVAVPTWTFRAGGQDATVNASASECSDTVIRTAGSCGLGGWTEIDPIGFPDIHLIMHVNTTCGGVVIACGNGICEPPSEDQCSCPADCGAPPADETPGLDCVDGLDNDCDGIVDCDEAACAADALCPANNFCAGALPAVEGCNAYTNVNATNDGPTCTAPTGDTLMGSDLWYTYTASCTGSVLLSFCDTNGCAQATDYDAAVGVFNTQVCTPAALDNIGCDDDSCGPVGGPPTLLTAVTAGDQLLIQVGGFSGSQGSGSFSLACVEPGGCCDNAAGTCVDGVFEVNCNGRFNPGAAGGCAGMSPPCGASACCAADGTCTDVAPGGPACTGQSHPGLLCGGVLCNVTGDCSIDNGPGDPNGGAPASQLDLTVPGGFFAEAADNFILKSVAGDGSVTCTLGQIVYWGTGFNFTAFFCSTTGAECDPNDPAACGNPVLCTKGNLDLCEDGLCSTGSEPCRVGGFPCPTAGDTCVPANPLCTKTPDDYSSIRVTVYNDATVPGVSTIDKAFCGSTISTGISPTACASDVDCTVPGQICVDTDGDLVPDTCGVTCDIIHTDVDPAATIVDLDIDLLIGHTFQGDLQVSLEHLNTGTSINLLNRPGQAACGLFGYSSDNFGDPVTMADADKLILSDEASVSIDTYNDFADPTCGNIPSGVNNYAGPASPTELLSAFDGELKDGTWRITVTDHVAADGGSLINWSLHFNDVVAVPKGPTGTPVNTFTAEACSVAADCITAGCPAGTTCIAGACDTAGLPCGSFSSDGSHTGAIKNELIVTSWTWVPFEKPVGTVIDDAFEITMDFPAGDVFIDQDKKNWLAIAPELALGSGWYQTGWMTSQNFGGNPAQQIFEPLGLFPWAVLSPEADLAFRMTGTKSITPCTTAADCADIDGNGITDDVCIWWACEAGACVSTDLIHPSDMGGAGGTCPPDTNCNLADALTALKCFSGLSPCEKINVDAGGAAGNCSPDGNCNLADALAALTCFAGTNTCTCGPSPTETNSPTKAGAATLRAVADARSIKAGSEVQVRMFVDQPLKALFGYQLTAVTSGGRSGSLELVDIAVEGRHDAVYARATSPFEAFNVENAQMLAGNFDGAVSTSANGYLATFTYRASDDAVGTFVVDVVRNDLTQTMMVGAEITDDIVVTGTRPAVIVVTSADTRSIR